MYDLIIIGAGPAGMTAGIYASRQKIKTLLIAKDFGGQVSRKAVTIKNYTGFKELSGLDLIKKFKEHLDSKKINIKMAEVDKVEKKANLFFVLTKKKKKFLGKGVMEA